MLDIAIKGFYTINEDGSVNKHNDQKKLILKKIKTFLETNSTQELVKAELPAIKLTGPSNLPEANVSKVEKTISI